MNAAVAEANSRTQAASAGYGFLAWLFLEPPDADFIARLLARDVQNDLRGLPSGSKAGAAWSAGWQEMSCAATGNGTRSVDETCLALQVERTRFLRGACHPDDPPPPYESLYLAPLDRGGTSVLAEVAEFYRLARVELPADPVDQLDSLGLELDLMRLLSEEENLARERKDVEDADLMAELQQRFLREHLLAWAPLFCEKMMALSTTGFYRGVARLLLGFLEEQALILLERQSGFATITR